MPMARSSLVAKWPSSELNAAPPAKAMPSQRFTTWPAASMGTKVRSREALIFWASLSSAKSQETCCHSVAPDARYIGLVTRRRETASSIAVAPLGQRRPSLTGLSGSPSICSSSTLPLASFLVYARSAHPTAQYGQTERETVAPSMRRCCCTCLACATSKPRTEAPIVPALTAPAFRNWRLVTSMAALLGHHHVVASACVACLDPRACR